MFSSFPDFPLIFLGFQELIPWWETEVSSLFRGYSWIRPYKSIQILISNSLALQPIFWRAFTFLIPKAFLMFIFSGQWELLCYYDVLRIQACHSRDQIWWLRYNIINLNNKTFQPVGALCFSFLCRSHCESIWMMSRKRCLSLRRRTGVEPKPCPVLIAQWIATNIGATRASTDGAKEAGSTVPKL